RSAGRAPEWFLGIFWEPFGSQPRNPAPKGALVTLLRGPTPPNAVDSGSSGRLLPPAGFLRWIEKPEVAVARTTPQALDHQSSEKCGPRAVNRPRVRTDVEDAVLIGF